MHDVTSLLQNFAVTAALKAENLRKEAADVKAEPSAGGFAEYDRVRDQKAANLVAEARKWDARAAKAKEGYLLVDADDQAFQMDPHWRELIDTCCCAGRCVYLEPQADPGYALT